MKFKVVLRIVILIFIILAAFAVLSLGLPKANSSELKALPESQTLPYEYQGNPQSCEVGAIVYQCSTHFIPAKNVEYTCEGFVLTTVGFEPKWVAKCENKSCVVVHSS